MTNKEAIERLQKCEKLELPLSTELEAFNLAIKSLEEQEWIPCNVSLPEDNEKYSEKQAINCLVTTNRGLVTKVQRIRCMLGNGDEYWYWGRIYGEVIAWRQLPKGYKKVS